MPLRSPGVSALARTTMKAAYDELDRTVAPGDKRDFGNTTLQDVQKAALDIENNLAARQSLRNLRRLMPLFQGLEHYSKVIDILCSGTPYLPWIWAPIALILRIASEYLEALDKIVMAYSSIAKSLQRFKNLDNFIVHPVFQETLVIFYADILEFHKHAYRFVRRNGWKTLFLSSWRRFQSRFNHILEDLKKQGSLIDQDRHIHNSDETNHEPKDTQISRGESKNLVKSEETKHKAKQFETTSEFWYTIDNDFATKMMDLLTESAPEPASNLCYSCTRLDVSKSGFTVECSLDHLRASSGTCKLCRLFLRAVDNSLGSDSGASLPNTASFYRNGSVLSLGSRSSVVLSLCAGLVPWNCLPEIQQGFPMLPEPRSPERFSLLQQFLHYCNEHHSCVPEYTGFMPVRVIDVQELRLVNTEELSPKEPYAALSWSRRVGWEVLETLRFGLEGRLDVPRKFGFTDLPLTVQDAVTVTKGFSIRFLWIESVCTIQDEEESWKREVESIGNIFRNAYCTIAATSARGLTDGFLRPRTPRDFVSLRTPEGFPVSVCEPIDDFQGDVDKAPLNTWAATFRERVMSRRIVHFAENQFYWQCGDGIHCETLTKISRPFDFLLRDSNSPKPPLEGMPSQLRAHQMLYELFSGLELRWPSDRLEEIVECEDFLSREAQTTAAYGVFDGDIARGLLWRRADSKPLAPIRPTEKLECPSWSWMAYSGRIVYMGVAKEESGVHWADVKVHGSPGLGRDPPSRQLRISGVCVAPTETVNVVYDAPDGRNEGDMGSTTLGLVMATYERKETGQLYECILFITQSDDGRLWRRIGVGELWRQADGGVERPLVDIILE